MICEPDKKKTFLFILFISLPFQYSENRDSMSSIQSDTSLEYPREKAASMVEGPTQGATGDM